MSCKNCVVITSALVVACAAGALAFAQQEGKGKNPHANPHAAAPAGQPEMKLPKGWTEADMQACMQAGMPGENHQFLAANAGTWHGKETIWMAPDTEPMHTTCTAVMTPMFEGRYTRTTLSGEMPGMGPFQGEATLGYDNVSGQFVSTWIDNHGTGIMQGTGKLSADKKTMTWNYAYNCPITKKPAVMREVDTFISQNEMKLEMFAQDPKSGKEYKMLVIDYTRK